jgi:hypothetical protein
MMRALRSAIGLLALAITPGLAFAQGGITPLLTGPNALSLGDIELRGHITIEDAIDLFGVYRQGIGPGFDFGLRLGFTDFAGGGLHIGGDLRYEIPSGDLELDLALAGGLQVSFVDRGNLISVPFGISLGTEVGSPETPVLLFGLPFLDVVRIDPDVGEAATDLQFGVELGGEIGLTERLLASAALVIASHDDDNVSLTLGLIYR